MKEKVNVTGVPETMVQTLYARAKETKKQNAKIKDEIAVELVEKLDYDFSKAVAKDCKSSVSNGNMQKQDGRDRQRKPQRKQRRSPGIFLQRQPERYRRLHQKMFRFCLP